MFGAIGLWLAKRFVGKWWSIVKVALPLLLIAAGAYWLYHKGDVHGKTTQATADQEIIDTAHHERDKAIKDKIEYVSSYNNWKQTSDQERKILLTAQTHIVDDLKGKLTRAEALANRPPETIIKEVTKYVTAHEDARCVLPRGVIRLYNTSLQSSAGTAGTDLPGGYIANDSTPARVPLSVYTGIVVTNNHRALYYYQLVQLWQAWYVRNKAAFEHAQATIELAQPATP